MYHWYTKSMESNHTQHLPFIVIGAGPVGLFTAILLGIQGARVIVFEKRTEYVRDQTIRWWPSFFASLYLYPVLYTERGRALCQMLTEIGIQDSINKKSKSSPLFSTQIRILEQKLLDFARTIPNVELRHQEVSSWSDLKACGFPPGTFQRVYACDGARSKWRASFFRTETDHIQRILELKHEEELPVDVLRKIRATHTVTRLSANRTHIVLDEKEYQDLMERFKGLPSCGPPEPSVTLGSCMRRAQRQPLLASLQLSSNTKLHLLNYTSYWSDSATCGVLYLVGDSLYGVSFARALRNGLLCSLNATMLYLDHDYQRWWYENYYWRLQVQEKALGQVLGRLLHAKSVVESNLDKLPTLPAGCLRF